MPLPDPTETCLDLEIDVSLFLSLSIELPGGISISAFLKAGEFPSLGSLVGDLLGNLNAALAPLMPFFRILDVVIAIVDFCVAVPDSLGPPPDPTLLIKRLRVLLKAFARLTALFPPLSIPILIVGVCRVIVAALKGLILELEFQLTASLKLELARARADALLANPLLVEGAANLMASIDCASIDLAIALELSVSGLGPLNKLISLLNALAKLAGLPELLAIDAGGDVAGMLDPLKAAVDAVEAFCASIPV
jgi:hypothetical protein